MSFFTESIKNIKTVGTVSRSSKALCLEAVKQIDFSQAEFLVELGAGDGVITKYILERMRPDCKLMVFEVHKKFCVLLRAIDDPRLIVVEASAQKIDTYLKQHSFSRVDDIISAIPFVVVPEQETSDIMEACKAVLKTGGKFIQVHYSLILKKMYQKVFGNVAVNFVLLNLPPAWIIVSVK